jgi:5-methylcytosine-specific restriction enzyme B
VDGYAGRLIFPENLYVIGTVNMDETTFPFSRKVLDRANTIEFSYVDLMSGLEEPEEGGKPLEPLDLENSFFRSDWLLLRQCLQSPENREFVEKWCGKLKELNEILQKADAHVGYRVRDEILFYLLYNKKGGLLTDSQAFDREILQKILPRIQGSSTAIRELLTELYKVCAGDYEEYQTDSGQIYRKMEKFRKDHKEQIPYPETAKKLIYMMRRYEEDGFTSYWL